MSKLSRNPEEGGARMRLMLSGKATCNSHGQDSPYFLGWEKYEKNPYDQIQNPQGIIQMGLPENQLSFDLLESGLSENQDIAGFKRNGDQIPNLTTASASRDGASPTSPQVVDDSISVVVDGSQPINDGAIRRLNAHGTRTTTTAGSSQVRTFNSSQPSAVHPIVVLFQRQELGKAVLGFAVPMATGLLFTQYRGLTHLQASAIVLVLSIGIAITWNGILLHGICRRVATALECFGAMTILTSFFGLVSSFLSPSLVWACWLCCGFSWLPFIWCLVLPAEIEKESSAKRLDQDVV